MSGESEMTLLKLVLGRLVELSSEAPSAWVAIKLAPRAIRLVGFVVTWAMTMQRLDVDVLSPEDYALEGYDSRATTYRRLDEYKQLFPSFTIDDMARLVIEQNASRLATASPAEVVVGKLPRSVSVAAA